MGLYVGIDLHSTSSYIGVIDQNLKRILGRKVPNEREAILQSLLPHKNEIESIAVESTYNWYWLVDALMEDGYCVKLANPAAMKQYEGIKYLNDKQDAFWLAHMLKLGILPEGYIYPKESRGLRDLLRQRSYLVVQKTSLKHRLQQFAISQTGVALRNNDIGRMEVDSIGDLFEGVDVQENGRNLLTMIQLMDEQVQNIEGYILKKIGGEKIYQSLTSVPGIGKILGLTISLETGPIERFDSAGNYASYCRCVPSSYWSNEKKKGSGNQKNGNKYLSWAFAEAANFCIRFNADAKRYYQKKSARTNQPSAYRAMANKLAKACYFVMRDGVDFDSKRLFLS